MNPATRDMPGRMSDAQREALISLLGDDDPAVYETVRQKLLACGPEAAEWLKPHELNPDPLLRRRARAIRQHFALRDADNEFLTFCLRQGDDFDLDDGVWLLARTRYPDINVEAYRALLDSFAGELREEIGAARDSSLLLALLNDFLFNKQKFTGNSQNYYEADNSYINRVLDRRTGNPISLCTIYLLVCRRLRLPVVGIGLPGHFICRYQSATEVVFIDVFSQGRLLTKADCIKYLHHNHHGLYDEFLTPVSPRRMLMRMCSNLHQIYQKTSQAEDAARFQRYLVALAR